MVEILIDVGPFIFFIALGLFAGRYNEHRHLVRLAAREAELKHLLVNNLKHVQNPADARQSAMVMGSVVIATDYLKTFLMTLRNLVGGEAKSAMTLMERARREAIVRMLDEADAMGAAEVWNVRFEFCNIAMMNGKKGAMQVEVLAYGTAVVR